jgi:hypothetical protein
VTEFLGSCLITTRKEEGREADNWRDGVESEVRLTLGSERDMKPITWWWLWWRRRRMHSELLGLGRCPSGILETWNHNLSEIGLFSSSGEGGRHLLSWVTQKELTWITDFLVSRISDDGHSPKTQQFWVLYTSVRTL